MRALLLVKLFYGLELRLHLRVRLNYQCLAYRPSNWSKAAFIKCYPTNQSYQNAGGAESLQQCMDPIVQNAFTFLLPNLKKYRILFLASSSTDLYTAIQRLYRLSTIVNYKSLLTNIYLAQSDIFNQQLCDIYVQNVLNLLSQYPTLLDKTHGGTSPKIYVTIILTGYK